MLAYNSFNGTTKIKFNQMANWAQNWVNFLGEETQIKKVNAMFKAMHEKEKETNEGQIPPFMKEPKQDWFFEIYEDDSEVISYATKWSPNVLDLIEIANYFNLGFEVRYEESSNQIFGKAIFTAGNTEAKFYDLKSEDFDQFEYNEDNDIYTYKGEEYECESDILDIIFEEKFNFSF